ncbi:DUF6861 domain-containing protein [Bradyrhizobium sp. S3.2.12]|uniref:eCIS core domain-containing protein n=1 Tax=Bradyrhizobium sp. S3.2.12 TaxID=3156387 RepID=UPI00339B3C55
MSEERASMYKPTVAERRSSAALRAQPGVAAVRPMTAVRTLQQRLGNQGTQAFAAQQAVARSGASGMASTSGAATAQLSVSQPGDPQEREAENVADRILRMPQPAPQLSGVAPAPTFSPTPIVQRRCAVCEEERAYDTTPIKETVSGGPSVHRQEGSTTAQHVPASVSADIRALQGRGSPLPAATRGFFEPRFGANLSQVRVHTDTHAARTASSIDAKAFTVGPDIAFGAGQFSPYSQTGRRLLAHELTHVVQQDRSTGHNHVISREPAGAGSAPPKVQSVDVIPAGGAQLDKVGIVAWDGSPGLRLRSTPNTVDDNVVANLGFNTHLQVIKAFPGSWYFVSTQDGQLGYAASDYIKTNLPEPNAKLHKVESGPPGFAISIAEQYYKQYANDWGQDLRFYVNVLAWVNKRNVPNTTAGWKEVSFKAGEFIWIPTHPFARSLRNVVNSGSITHNIADVVGIADFLDRVGELWDDIRTAIALSKKSLLPAIGRHVEAALLGVLHSIAMMLVMAVVVLAISTAIGAAIGALAGGVGAAPGAAAGFEIGMVILNWLGLGMLLIWVAQSLASVAGAFGTFLGGVWNARGDIKKLDLAAQQFAEAVGVLCGVILEALVMWAVSIGASQAIGALQGSRFGKAFNNSKTGEWLNERVRRVKAGEAALPTPKDALSRIVRNTELVDAKNSPIGEFDGIDMGSKKFFENKSATGIDKPNPRTGKPQQTAADWAAKQVTKKTMRRIQALRDAAGTRARPGTTGTVPALGEIQGFRHIHFMIDGNSPALRAAVFAELAILRANNPGWTFTAAFGITVILPPMPGTGQPDE